MSRNNRGKKGVGVLSLASVALTTSLALATPRVPTHVACVGDSITYGYGASNQATKSYPANLQALLGASVQVKNFGHNAATMLSAPFGDLPYEDQPEYAAASDFVSGAGASAVTSVIIMLGTNDSKNFNWAPSGKPKNDQQFLKDYRLMVEHFSALTPKPVVYLALPLATGTSPCCSIDGTVIHDEELPLIKQLATEMDLPTIDLNTPTSGHPEYFGDGVHPNDAAYALVAQWMRDGLLADRSSAGTGAGGAGAGGAGGTGGAAGAGAGAVGTAAGGRTIAGDSGSSGLATAGSVGSLSGGGGSSSVASAGTGAAGAAQSGASSSGGPGSNPAAGSQSILPPNSAASGCAVSGRSRGADSLAAFGLLGLAWLAARRRAAPRKSRAASRMCYRVGHDHD